MSSTIIKNIHIVNEGIIITGDVWIEGERIKKVGGIIEAPPNAQEIDGTGKYLIPGVIDDQVHFREPGLTHKAEIYTEAKATVAGGVTSFMEMPNTFPPATTQELLEQKYQRAAQVSLANYSFYMGAGNDNLREVLQTNPETVCGIKAFMGSSTGNMLVDNPVTLERLFAGTPMLIATHCEDETTIRENLAAWTDKYGEDIPIEAHPEIRSAEACWLSSNLAVDLAHRHGTRLHILHISTEKELELFTNKFPLEQKRVTAEVCVHHLWFDSSDYERLSTLIKCNPAIKERRNKKALFEALLDDRLDIIATDHAPHTRDEKFNKYSKAPSGIPLVQHALPLMLQFYHQGMISLEKIVEKMCHAPAVCFRVRERGFIREGWFADLAIIDLNRPWKVDRRNILYKCGWSPFEDKIFNSEVTHTFVNGHLAYSNGMFNEGQKGQRLLFDAVR